MLASLFITLLCALSLARADSDTHITCAAGVAHDDSFAWWNNKHDQNPCVVLQNLLRQCDPDHTIHKMPGSPVHAPDICEHSSAKKKSSSKSSSSSQSSSSKSTSSSTSTSSTSASQRSTASSSKSKRGATTAAGSASKSGSTSSATANSTSTATAAASSPTTTESDGDDDDSPDGSNTDTDQFIPCCCNTAAYALREACWSCQQGLKEPGHGDRRPTFREYLQCPKPAPSHIYKNASVPRWALIPVDIDSQWNFDDTAKAAKQLSSKGHSMMMDSGNGPGSGGPGLAQGSMSSSAASASASAAQASMRMIAAIVGGVLGALAFVVLALTALICTQRRRRRRAFPASASRCPFRRTQCVPATDEKPLLDPAMGAYDAVPPARPRPALKAARVLGAATASWRSSLARLPEPVDYDAPLATPHQYMSYAGETDPGSQEPYSPLALTTPSMLEARRTIPSFSATHSFAV